MILFALSKAAETIQPQTTHITTIFQLLRDMQSISPPSSTHKSLKWPSSNTQLHMPRPSDTGHFTTQGSGPSSLTLVKLHGRLSNVDLNT